MVPQSQVNANCLAVAERKKKRGGGGLEIKLDIPFFNIFIPPSQLLLHSLSFIFNMMTACFDAAVKNNSFFRIGAVVTSEISTEYW